MKGFEIEFFGNLDLLALELEHVGCQSHKTLLPGPADPDQHNISSRLSEDSGNAQQVVDCVIKEDELHFVGVFRVVIL